MNREEYWENYYEYWKAKVGDKDVPKDNVVESFIARSNIKEGKLLEVGCGWGRLFDFYSPDLEVYAIDISMKMVEKAEDNRTDNVIQVLQAEAEEIPFFTNMFDYVICIATFDTTNQEKALSEMLRVLKIGGKLLVTGKNNNYFKDDKEAYEAEKGARKKGHPNFFTDIIELKKQLKQKKHKIISEYYFLKKGDFAERLFVKYIPLEFYEYFLVIEKGSKDVDFRKFSDWFSLKNIGGSLK